ncbi:hypothetical protein glysoja_043894 [Glycine soja]|uniref:Uncharacterized protein n=1 Tax=Glycine soja TaxID=3848 RepID=A0A0B2PM41_GLYSO|nr:hypothetical protein glysoja_043894 [Glycine soja]
MVQLMKNSRKPETSSCGDPVKLEIVEDPLEEEHGPHNKRCKPSPSPSPQPQVFYFVSSLSSFQSLARSRFWALLK